MKYYIIAGEASGDLHASNLMQELKNKDAAADFRFWGGDLMLNHSKNIVKHYRELAFMGLTDVLKNIFTIRKNFQFCESDLLEYKPDVLILVDYPGFNLRMAKFAHQNGIKVFYYISPKVWAWRKKRAYKIKEFVDKLFVIFPFETDFYKTYDYEVEYVGNPLLDAIENKRAELLAKNDFIAKNKLSEKPIIALLAGSRKQEVRMILPEMLEAVSQFADYQIVLAGAPGLAVEFYEPLLQDSSCKLIMDQTYNLLEYADAALVTSGTATLETALFKVPQVVCYKTSKLTYFVGTKLVNVEFFSLVNIVMGREIVKELMQYDLVENMEAELRLILENKEYRSEMLKNYDILEEKLGGLGASERSAEKMISLL